MARIPITADCLARLEGVIADIEWTNDSAVAVVSVDPDGPAAVLIDLDADRDTHLLLGLFGLMPAERQRNEGEPVRAQGRAQLLPDLPSGVFRTLSSGWKDRGRWSPETKRRDNLRIAYLTNRHD